MILQVLAAAFLLTIETQASEMLEGGKWAEQRDDVEIREKTMSVPVTNQPGEGDFGTLGQMKETMPSATPATLKINCMIRTNKPISKFLQHKTEEEKSDLWENARRSFPERKQQEKAETEEFRQGSSTQKESQKQAQITKQIESGKKSAAILPQIKR